MARKLDMVALEGAASYYASEFMRDPDKVMGEFFKFRYKDEFEAMCDLVRDNLGPKMIANFEAKGRAKFAPRDDKVFAAELKKMLAVDPDGKHIVGSVGEVKVASRFIRMHDIEVATPAWLRARKECLVLGIAAPPRETRMKRVPLYWPVYAGEGDERAAGRKSVDPLPAGTPGLDLGALNSRISNECAILACDAVVDNLDEGAGAAVIQIRTGAQPADPDTAVTGTLCATLVMSDPAFLGAADANPGATATASSITDDSSADATGTAGYFRASSTADGATPADDHLDGEAGTGTADLVLNTVSIVAGSTVSITAYTVTMPES